MKFRSPLDFFVRPIPQEETPAAARKRRAYDWMIAGLIGAGLSVALFFGLFRQVTRPIEGLVVPDATPRRAPVEAIEVDLIAGPAADAEPEPGTVIAAPDPKQEAEARAAAEAEEFRLRIGAELRSKANALTPPPADAPPPPPDLAPRPPLAAPPP
jgi:hypothetical protein